MKTLASYFPVFKWGAEYSRQTLASDLVAAVIVTIMLIPQSLAYALLAGLPAYVGLYASMVPLLLYAVFGTSRALAVGPVAIVSLLTAAAAAQVATAGTPEYLTAAIALAAISGFILLVMGLLRLGFLANFLSHPVISGFITAAALQIAASQLGPFLGIKTSGKTLLDLLISLVPNLGQINFYTAAIGVATFIFLLWVRRYLKPLLQGAGLNEQQSDIFSKVGPAMAIVVTTAAVWALGLGEQGVSVVGEIPQGLPSLALPQFDSALWMQLVVPALMIAIIGYVESISTAMTLAAKKRQRVDPDQELIALGMSNIGSSVSGGFSVTGGISRSVVSFESGAETPAAGAYTAIGVALATLFLTPLLFFLPKTTLAAIIIVAVLSMVNFAAIKHTFIYSRADGMAMIGTILMTWVVGVETGLMVGVGLSIFLHLYHTSKPHIAVVGQLPGTMNFRNVERHEVVTDSNILSLRIDASLYFPNARFIEEYINNAVAANPGIEHLILECPAVNTIDASALESLESINHRLKEGGITFHLSEVKGPIMDRLKRSDFLNQLTGKVYLTHFDAVSSINPVRAQGTLKTGQDETR